MAEGHDNHTEGHDSHTEGHVTYTSENLTAAVLGRIRPDADARV